MENKSQIEQNYYYKSLQCFSENKTNSQIDDGHNLPKIKNLLNKNNTTKSTAKKLGEFISDANDDLKILIVGDNQTEKSKFINSLLNREIFPTNQVASSFINSIIKYGEEETVTAYFFDGQIAQFTTSQIALFAVSDSFSSQLMRDGLDYLEVTLNNEFLKTITLFDTPSYRKSVFIKERFLNRSQLVLWLTTQHFRGLPSERALVKTIEQKNNHLLYLVETDDVTKKITNILSTNDFFTPYSKINFSISKLLAAHEADDTTLYEQSNIHALFQEIQNARFSKEESEKIKVASFLHWVERFTLELKSICHRAPYSEAYELLRQFKSQEREFMTQKNEQIKKVKELNSLYEAIRSQFNNLSTGHQLVEFLKEYHFNEQNKVQYFIQDYQDFQQRSRLLEKTTGPSEARKSMELEITAHYEGIKPVIYRMVQQRLIETEQSIIEVNSFSEYKRMQLDRACKRIQSFDPIVEAKNIILTELRMIPTNEKAEKLQTVLAEIQLDYGQYIAYYKEYLKTQPIETLDTEKKSVYNEVLDTIVLYK